MYSTTPVPGCWTTLTAETLTFSCSTGSTLRSFDTNIIFNRSSINTLQVTGHGGKGPLTSIPEDVCLFENLTQLILLNNQLTTAEFNFSHSCLPQLRVLNLYQNYLEEIPVKWISQMSKLESITLSYNNLTKIPYKLFENLPNLKEIYLSQNQLETFELWLFQLTPTIYYSYNPVKYFTNIEQIDLSKSQFSSLNNIILTNIPTTISFDDGVFEMVNRCEEVHSLTNNTNQSLMRILSILHDKHPNLLNWTCTCEQYYLGRYMLAHQSSDTSTSWKCSTMSLMTFDQMCPNQTSFNTKNVSPRLCQISNSSEHVNDTIECSNIDCLLRKIYSQLNKTMFIDQNSVHTFADIVYRSDIILQSISNPIADTSIEKISHNIIQRIENFLESITIPINLTRNTISILSLQKNSPINSYSQNRLNNTSISYSTNALTKNFTTSITFEQAAFEYLNESDVYTFYYLPIVFFRLAQITNRDIIIIEPIVGLHFPKTIPYSINLSFTDIERSNGDYSCVFWDTNQWNPNGCKHSFNSKVNRHFCSCNHTTSFALIFIPHKTIDKTYIPSITIAFVSIVCFCISIILSISRQTAYFRHLSVLNIFTLFNSMVLFLLFGVILIQGYQSSRKFHGNCSMSQKNLVVTTYFFLLLTFASKTLLGICYFLTIIFHFIFIQCASMSTHWFYSGIGFVVTIAFVPTIILRQSMNLFQSYQGICWLSSFIVFRFISIPILIFIGTNSLIIGIITVRLLKFVFQRKTMKIIERRLMISTMIWLSLCITLGLAWIFGPFLDLLVVDKDQTSSIVQLWIFAIFFGLEGLWVLIVNIIFYVNQKLNSENRQK